MKYCKVCKETKDQEEFPPYQNRGKRGLRGECRPCNQRKRIPGIRKRLLAEYGLTPEQYDAMLELQDGLCAICLKPPSDKSLCVDHDHDTGQVRGLLCRNCNLAIGYLKDSPVLTERATEYLQEEL